MRTWALITVGALFYAVCLLATAPASLITTLATRWTGAPVELREVEGTAWRGAARLFARDRSGQLQELLPLRWKARFAPLAGTFGADLRLGDAATDARLRWSSGGTTLDEVDLDLAASLLERLVPALRPLGPEGRVHVRAPRLRIHGGAGFVGEVEIRWYRASFRAVPDAELGVLSARIRGDGAEVGIELAALEGPLRLSGRGTWSAANGISVAGVAEPASADNGPLASLLRGLCSEYRDGRCLFRFGSRA